ncbi:hypothetical protein WJX73_001441 [Symbiochloris irregularis]|uniref:Uncharacterized protein n=1 Tax=Symbiochloris irregularis TaxID=706552 RepID=A0AAW1PQN1_9CHLO
MVDAAIVSAADKHELSEHRRDDGLYAMRLAWGAAQEAASLVALMDAFPSSIVHEVTQALHVSKLRALFQRR